MAAAMTAAAIPTARLSRVPQTFNQEVHEDPRLRRQHIRPRIDKPKHGAVVHLPVGTNPEKSPGRNFVRHAPKRVHRNTGPRKGGLALRIPVINNSPAVHPARIKCGHVARAIDPSPNEFSSLAIGRGRLAKIKP
jgi:hypothetical protein